MSRKSTSTDPLRALIGVGEKEAALLRAAGLSTPAAVADASIQTLVQGLHPRIRRTGAGRIHMHARALTTGQAQMLKGGRPAPPLLVHLDLEAAHDGQDQPWMVGIMRPGDDDVSQVIHLEPANQGQTIRDLDALMKDHPTARMCSWGNFDQIVLRRTCKRLRMREPAWVGRWFDACAWARQVLLPPCPGYGLKKVAAAFGFAWQEGDLDGYTVGRAYSRWRDTGSHLQVDRIASYNADDVRALKLVVERIEALRASPQR